MRLVFGGFLIVSGLTMAAVGGLDRAHTNVSHLNPEAVLAQSSAPGAQHSQVNTIVTLPARSRAPEEPMANASRSALVAGADLVSELQRELTRVECYDGPVNGHWSTQSRRAMAAFLERANARLPTDQAEGVLLALIKHHSGPACGSCPTGQEASTDGRCVPQAIAVRAAAFQPLAKPSVVGESARMGDAEVPHASRRTRRRAPIEGRMGVGGPPIAAKPSNRVSKITEGQPPPSDEPPVARPRRGKLAARHANRRMAAHSRRYLRAMRAPRYAYRPRGIAALLFGWF
jgi:hypothetical protein